MLQKDEEMKMTGVSWISCGLRKGVLLLSHLLNESPRSWNLGGAPHPGMTVGNSEFSQLWAQVQFQVREKKKEQVVESQCVY